ncbi:MULTISPECIES: sigma factor-like helix-turn-helix DNA-binding protein [unclassified Clostridium]|uniref:sigma factor-like helix-turn-helix DNA-binding protein n=1 Tax=unclassified Clostridium TaxID=2614128 RepID=UPI0025C5BD4E|nr:sigma factor-like helix-turn-helix DNA-binding protein [Clostridium sp.]MCI6693832.1 RNA polymerase subunit sigma-24 [Clostridium sp.]MDY4251004.1 sigma factor-like helix-turn-helix DNA-binding protein [Clostridium sp.]
MSKHLIENSNNEDEYFLEILYKLKSKIDYLSYKLNYPEANTDLIISLLKTFRNLDESKFNTQTDLLNYLKRCLDNSSIKLYYSQKKYTDTFTFCSEFESLANKNSNFNDLEFSDVFFESLLSDLSPKEKSIISKKFKLQLSDSEIAKQNSVSRQAINKSKKIALQKLKKNLIF